MGLTYIEGKVIGPNAKSTMVNFLVDSGTKYTLLTKEQWTEIELVPRREMTFILVDGTKIHRNVSECLISLPQGEGHTPVILGEADDEPLLGVVTLEELGLTFNPFNRTLSPARSLLM